MYEICLTIACITRSFLAKFLMKYINQSQVIISVPFDTNSAPRQSPSLTHSVMKTTVDARYAFSPSSRTREMRNRMTVVEVVSVRVERMSRRKRPPLSIMDGKEELILGKVFIAPQLHIFLVILLVVAKNFFDEVFLLMVLSKRQGHLHSVMHALTESVN